MRHVRRGIVARGVTRPPACMCGGVPGGVRDNRWRLRATSAAC